MMLNMKTLLLALAATTLLVGPAFSQKKNDKEKPKVLKPAATPMPTPRPVSPAKPSVHTGSLNSQVTAGSLSSGKAHAGSLTAGKPSAGSLPIGRPSAGSLPSGKPTAGSLASGVIGGSVAPITGRANNLDAYDLSNASYSPKAYEFNKDKSKASSASKAKAAPTPDAKERAEAAAEAKEKAAEAAKEKAKRAAREKFLKERRSRKSHFD